MLRASETKKLSAISNQRSAKSQELRKLSADSRKLKAER